MVHGVCQDLFEVCGGCFCSACCCENLESKATMMGKDTAVFIFMALNYGTAIVGIESMFKISGM